MSKARSPRKLISQIGTLSRYRPEDPELPELRREYAVVQITDAIRKAMEKSPPLREDQKAQVMAALNSYGETEVGHA